ncbi:MAG: Fe-S cluster assembly protein HesB [Cocleimonas sp.]|nr:Fe-S cluster assembly protein HesB [Cocleimonas sp.]
MFTVSPEAATQIKISITQSGVDGEPLRVAVEKNDAGEFHYQMGFDDSSKYGDSHFVSGGVKLVADAASGDLLNGMMIDYIDLDGTMEFVFMNPNDPNYKAPQE